MIITNWVLLGITVMLIGLWWSNREIQKLKPSKARKPNEKERIKRLVDD